MEQNINLNTTSPIVLDNDDNSIFNRSLFSNNNRNITSMLNQPLPPLIDVDVTNNSTSYSRRLENIMLLLNTIGRIDDNNNNNNNYYSGMNTFEINKYIDPSLIPELKKKIIFFNDKKYSYYHLCKLNLTFRNKYNVLLNIDFSVKKVLLRCKYVIKLILLDKESYCNNLRCDQNFCNGETHLCSKRRKTLLEIDNFSLDDLMINLEGKIQDFKFCIECNTLWNINNDERLKDEENNFDICDNCVFKNHMNSKTLDIIETCSICLKNIYENDFEKTLCKHYFHKECINTWLLKKKSCPLCRHKLKNNEYQIIEEL